MARGFESKDVEYQQAEADRAKNGAPTLDAGERDEQTRRRTVELALSRARSDLAKAHVPAHRRMLEQAIAALEQQLAPVSPGRLEPGNAVVK
jgi:hypothetical protein